MSIHTFGWPVEDAGFELERALRKFGPMASPHEGWAVIKEELDELWEANTGRSDEARTEAIQIAAMAMRYALDLCDPLLASPVSGESPRGEEQQQREDS